VYRTAGARAAGAEPLYRPDDGHYQFKYLPAFALVSVPLSWIPAETGKALWFVASFGLLIVFVRESVRSLPERRRSERALYWLAALLVGKFYVRELVLGQTNLLLGVLLLAALAASRQRGPTAGALVGAAVFVKPYAAVLLPWLVVAQGWRSLAPAAAVLAGGLLAPALVYGWNGNLDLIAAWYRTVTQTTAPNLLHPENISLAALWAKWLEPGPMASRLALASGALLMVLPARVVAARRRVPDPGYLEFGLLMLLVPLLSPQGWDYVLLLATPAVVCLVDRWRELGTSVRVASAAATAVLSFSIFDLIGRAAYTWLMRVSALTVAAIVLAVVLAHMRWRALA
jgi:hypothetical protein